MDPRYYQQYMAMMANGYGSYGKSPDEVRFRAEYTANRQQAQRQAAGRYDRSGYDTANLAAQMERTRLLQNTMAGGMGGGYGGGMGRMQGGGQGNGVGYGMSNSAMEREMLEAGREGRGGARDGGDGARDDRGGARDDRGNAREGGEGARDARGGARDDRGPARDDRGTARNGGEGARGGRDHDSRWGYAESRGCRGQQGSGRGGEWY